MFVLLPLALVNLWPTILSPQGIGIVMLALGISALVTILSFGVFTQASFLAGPAIFITAGGLKILLSLLGSVSFFIKKKPLFAIVSAHLFILYFFKWIDLLKKEGSKAGPM